MNQPHQTDGSEPLTITQAPLAGSKKLFALGGISFIAYLYWFRLSFGPLGSDNAEPLYITNFLITYAVLFACYWMLIMPLLKGQRMDPRHLWFAIAISLLFRAVMLPADLMLEDDIYRYMWDGHMQTQGVNPYQYAPSAPETEPYRTEYWGKINFPYIPTIYPPTLQYLFLVSNIIYPGSVLGMKLLLVMFDTATIFLMLSLLRNLSLPGEWCLVYAWSPLVIKEIANSGHADSVSAFLIVAVLWLASRRQNTLTAVAMALLTLTKFFGVFLLPLFHRQWGWRHYLLCGSAMLMLYLPFINTQFNLFEGFLTYSRDWRFNAGIYDWLRDIFYNLGWKLEFEFQNKLIYWTSSDLARYALFATVVLVAFYQTIMMEWRTRPLDLSRAFFIVLGTLLMCSPVIDPWYLTWIAPLLCLHPSRAWLLFTGLVYLSYIFYYDNVFPAWVQPVEYGLFFALLLLEYFLPSWRLGQCQTSNENPCQSEAREGMIDDDSNQLP